MAYKFQFGAARMSGSLTQEEGMIIDAGGLKVTAGGINLDAGGLDANNTGMTNVGAVSGVSTLAIGGALSGVTTIAASGLASLGSLAVDDSSTIGCDSDTDLITLASTKVTLASNAALEFADAGEKISRSGDGYLDILAGTKINLSGAVGMNGTCQVSGDLAAATITMTGFAVDADGDTNLKALRVDDGSTIGCDSDTDLLTLASTTVTVASNAALQFADAGEKISRSADGFLDILAGTKVNLSGAVGMNSTLAVVGAVTMGGAVTLGDATGDDLTFTGRAASSVVPKTDGSYDLGTTTLRWGTIYVDNIVGADTKFDVETVAGGATIAAGTDFALCSAGNGTTVTLPALGASSAGKSLYIKLSASVGDQIIAAGSNDFIEGTLGSIRLESTGSAVQLVAYDAGTWFVV